MQWNFYRFELDVSYDTSNEEIDQSYRINYLQLRHNLKMFIVNFLMIIINPQG